jgi:intron-binding protein aquarius
VVDSYLWPNFSKASSDQLVLSIALLTTVKAYENLPIWGMHKERTVLIIDAFSSNVDVFPELFQRVLAMTSVTTMSFITRRLLLAFVIHAFQSLDVGFVKKELATLAQVHIWAGLSSEDRRNAEFEKHPPLRKIWKGSVKRFDATGTIVLGVLLILDDATKKKLRFEQSWLYSLMIDFLSIIYAPGSKSDRIFLVDSWLIY